MATLKVLLDAYIAAKGEECDGGLLSRCNFWRGTALAGREVSTITPDDVDDVMIALAERGKLKVTWHKRGTEKAHKVIVATGKPLKGPTLNRYLSELGCVFEWAKRTKVLRNSFDSPTRPLSRMPEPVDRERYLRPDEIARVVAIARARDKRYKKMPALITVAYHTGWRVGSLMKVQGKHLNLQARTIVIPKTKNGDGMGAALSSACFAELKKLGRIQPDELVFGNRWGKPYEYGPLWDAIAREAELEGKTFHFIRHAHGHTLATAGESGPNIMQSMGHRTLTASARYTHGNTADKARVIARVFG